MFDRFFPDQYVASTYVIDFEKLYEEGVRGLKNCIRKDTEV